MEQGRITIAKAGIHESLHRTDRCKSRIWKLLSLQDVYGKYRAIRFVALPLGFAVRDDRYGRQGSNKKRKTDKYLSKSTTRFTSTHILFFSAVPSRRDYSDDVAFPSAKNLKANAAATASEYTAMEAEAAFTANLLQINDFKRD